MKILHAFRCFFNTLFQAGALIIILYYFAACKNAPEKDGHQAYITTIQKRMDTIQNENIDNTLAFIDSLFYTLPNPGMGDIYVTDSIKQISYGFIKHDYIKSLSYTDSMLWLIKGRTGEETYAERYARLLYEKGDCFRHLKRYYEAFHYISLAEEAVLNHVKNKCSMTDYSGSKALLMFAQEKYRLSAVYFLQQYQVLLSACNSNSYRQLMNQEGSINNAALCYLKAGMLDSAAYYEKTALNIILSHEKEFPSKHYNISYAKAVIYGDQAEVLALKGKFNEAEALFKKSIDGTSSADINYTQSTQARLADIYLKDNKTAAAHQVLNELKISLDTLNNEAQLIRWHKLNVKYYTQSKQVDSAFKYQQQYEILRDSVDVRDKKFVTVDLGKEFENLELKYSNEVLQKEGKLKSLYLAIAMLIVIMAAAIAMLVWYNLNRARKLNTQIQQNNDDLHKVLSSLEQSHQENNRIMRIVAHDLKNPISAINNLIYSLLRKDYPGDLKEIFELIKTACGNSMALIKDVLHDKKDPSVIRKELVDMKRLMEYCVDLLQAKADEKKQQLTLQAENAVIMLNRQKMWRVISNIVNNAIKFSPEYAVINIKLQRRDESILLSVQDKGIGIPVNLQDQIFTLSPEASRPGTSGEESYGLGLSISRKIIEEHDGKIWFDSTDGKGSVFYIELPYLN